MAGDRNYNAPPKGRQGLPDTTGNKQPSMDAVRKAAGSARGATKTGPIGQCSQAGGPPMPRHTAQKPGV